MISFLVCFSPSSFFFFFFLVCTPFIFTQVLGESLHITLVYLASEAKVESARSHASSVEVENSKLRKDLIAAMDKANTSKEKAKILFDDLRVERQLTLEKESCFWLQKRRSRWLLPSSSRPFSRRRSTTLCSSAGIIKALSS